MLFVTRKTLAAGLRLLLVLSASLMIVVLKKKRGKGVPFKDEDALKRAQTLQIDVAFIIHGSKNITSPPRKKSFKEALDWAKKITKAFGEVGVNKTNIGLILYAEKAKLMFNMTEKLDKGAIMEGLEKASSPPALGNKTFTGKALKLALKTLVKETRKEAIKKFFVFADRPPDDDPTPPAEAVKENGVEVYGLGGSAPPSTWFIHDFSLDSMYAMLKEGPFKGVKESIKDKSYQDITDISIPTQKPVLLGSIHNNDLKIPKPPATEFSAPGNVPQNSVNVNASNSVSSQNLATSKGGLSSLGNVMSHPGNQTSNSENTVFNLASQEPHPGNPVSNPEIPTSNSINSTTNSGNAVNPGSEMRPSLKILNPINLKPEHQISGLISKENNAKEEDYTNIKYGKDASLVITENSMKSKNSVGRYSSTTDVTPSATEFGTVIGGVRVNGQSKFDVIKPSNNSQNENSNLRSKLGIGKLNKR